MLNLAGQFYAEVGRLRETFDLARQAIALNPLYRPPVQWHTGPLGVMGHHGEAQPLWEAHIARWPDVEALVGEAMATAPIASRRLQQPPNGDTTPYRPSSRACSVG